jgi:ABC-2 type transport system permease protein
MTAFLTHFSNEFRIGIRNKNLLLLNYLFPLGFYALASLIMTGINPSFKDQLIPAMAIFSIVVSTTLGMPESLVAARENGIFRSYKINGVPALSILVIPAFTTILHVVIVGSIITATAPIFFGGVLPQNWLMYALIFLVTAFCSAGMGVLIGVIAPNSRATIFFSQAIFLPSMLIGGLMVPASMLPDTFQKIGMLLPSTHSIQAFQALAWGREALFSPWGAIIVLFFAGFLAFALALFLFSWDSKNSNRRGSPILALLIFVPFIISIFVL